MKEFRNTASSQDSWHKTRCICSSYKIVQGAIAATIAIICWYCFCFYTCYHCCSPEYHHYRCYHCSFLFPVAVFFSVFFSLFVYVLLFMYLSCSLFFVLLALLIDVLLHVVVGVPDFPVIMIMNLYWSIDIRAVTMRKKICYCLRYCYSYHDDYHSWEKLYCHDYCYCFGWSCCYLFIRNAIIQTVPVPVIVTMLST